MGVPLNRPLFVRIFHQPSMNLEPHLWKPPNEMEPAGYPKKSMTHRIACLVHLLRLAVQDGLVAVHHLQPSDGAICMLPKMGMPPNHARLYHFNIETYCFWGSHILRKPPFWHLHLELMDFDPKFGCFLQYQWEPGVLKSTRISSTHCLLLGHGFTMFYHILDMVSFWADFLF